MKLDVISYIWDDELQIQHYDSWSKKDCSMEVEVYIPQLFGL